MEIGKSLNEVLINMALNDRISIDGRTGAVKKLLDGAIRKDDADAVYAMMFLAVRRNDPDTNVQRIAYESERCIKYVRSESIKLHGEAKRMLKQLRKL